MQLEIQKYLFDIQVSIDSINEYLGVFKYRLFCIRPLFS